MDSFPSRYVDSDLFSSSEALVAAPSSSSSSSSSLSSSIIISLREETPWRFGDMPNKLHQGHATIGHTNRLHDSNRSIPSSSTSSSLKPAHEITPLIESYGLRQRRGREMSKNHVQCMNINGLQEPCHANDGSWQQDEYDSDEENEEGEHDMEDDNGGYGGGDDIDDDKNGGNAHRKLGIDKIGALNRRDNHIKNRDDDDDDDGGGGGGGKGKENNGEGEKEGQSKSPLSSSMVRKEDVSSSSKPCDENQEDEKLKLRKKKKKKLHDYVCCRCASRFTVDCAAVCCCPLALAHLAVLALIRLPASLIWRMLINLKSRMRADARPPIRDTKFDEGSSARMPRAGGFNNSDKDVHGNSSSHHIIRFESQKLWQHFGNGDLDFGGFSMRAE